MSTTDTGAPDETVRAGAATPDAADVVVTQVDVVEVSSATPPRVAATQRFLSLDWARGWMLVATLLTVALVGPRSPQLEHARWLGVTVVDTIFPTFVLLSGVGLAFANRRPMPLRTTLRRSVTLLVCGLAFNAITAASLDWSTLRVTGPLTTYAALVLLIGVLSRVLRGVTAWPTVTVLLAAAGTAVTAWWATQCPTGVLTHSCNLSRVVDPSLLGMGHMYVQGQLGYDPEGLPAFAGILVTACVGFTAGKMVLRWRGRVIAPLAVVLWAAVAVAGGILAAQWVEPFKKQWTAPFALMTGALGLSILVVGIVVLDLPRARWWQRATAVAAWPVVALGRNSLLIYFGTHVTFELLVRSGRVPEIVDALGSTLAFLLVHAAAWWLLAMLLHWRGIYITAGGIRRPRPARART